MRPCFAHTPTHLARGPPVPAAPSSGVCRNELAHHSSSSSAHSVAPAHYRTGPLRVPVGVSIRDGHQEWFARPSPADGEDHFLFHVSDDFTPPHLPSSCRGWLTVGRRVRRGEGVGEVHGRQGREPLDRLNLVGPGMHRLELTASPSPVGTWHGGQRRSRTRRALGADVWRRLTARALRRDRRRPHRQRDGRFTG